MSLSRFAVVPLVVAVGVVLAGCSFNANLVTISDVEGTDYRVNVKVADTPKSGGESDAESEDEPASDEPEAPGDGEALYAFDHEVAKTAAGALEVQLGALPTVICEGDESDRVLIEDGTTVDCTVIDAKTGKSHDAVATISDVVGTDYVVNIKVG